MTLTLDRLATRTLDPAHDERVPDDATSLSIEDLDLVPVARLARLRQLRDLRVHGGYGDGATLRALARALPSLERLELRRCRALELDALVGVITELPSLDALTVDALAVPTAEVLRRVGPMRPWRALGLQFFDGLGDDFALPASLRELALQLHGPVDLARLAAVEGCRELESFEFFHSGDGEAPWMRELPWLARLPRLRALTGLRSDASVALLTALERLRLNDAPEAARLAELAALPRLRTLEIIGYPAGASSWSAAHTAALARSPALDALEAWKLTLDDDALAGLLRARPWRSLSLEGLVGPGAAFAAAPPTLEGLDLMFCELDDAGLRAVATLASLRGLGLSYCDRVTPAGVAALSSLRALRSFRAWGLRGLDDAGVAVLGSLPSLVGLDLHNVPRVSPAAVASLAARPGFAYTGPAALADAEALGADARAVTAPGGEGIGGDEAGALVALRNGSSVELAPLRATKAKKHPLLRVAAYQLRFDGGGTRVVTAGLQLIAWDVATGKKVATCKLPRGIALGVDLSDDGSLAATVLRRPKDSLVLGWRPDGTTAGFQFAVGAAEGASVSLSPDRQSLAVSAAHTARYEAATGREAWRVGETGLVRYSREGGRVALATAEGLVLLDAATGAVERRVAAAAHERAWWIAYGHGGLVRDRAPRGPVPVEWRALEWRADGGVVLLGQQEYDAVWVVARWRDGRWASARVAAPDDVSLHAKLALSQGAEHLLAHVRTESSEGRDVGLAWRLRVDALLDG